MGERKRQKGRHWIWLGVLAGVCLLILFRETGTLGSESKSRVLRVCCIGDSITYGSGLSGEEREKYSYPAQLQQLLGTQFEVSNYGVSGKTLLDIPDRGYLSTGYLDEVERKPPDILIIMLGTNDSRPENWDGTAYKEQYLALVQRMQGISDEMEIYLMTPPAAYPGEDGKIIYGINEDVIRDEIRQLVGEVAEETGTEMVDLYGITENHPEYFRDGVHPNRDGYEVIAHTVYENIYER